MADMVAGPAHDREGDRAIFDFGQAIRLNPKLSTACDEANSAGSDEPPRYGIRGEACEAERDLDNAIADFEQPLALDLSVPKAR